MIRRALLVCAALLAVSGCSTLTGRPLGTWAEDRGVTAHVKARLTAEEPANLTRIHVDTYEKTVYLTGGVTTAEMKRRAEAIARDVAGVELVVNNIHLSGEGMLAAAGEVSASPATTGAGSDRGAHPLLKRFAGLARVDLETGTPGWTRYGAFDTDGRRVATVYSVSAGELARNGAAAELTGSGTIDHVSIYRHPQAGGTQYDVVLWHLTLEEVGRLE